MQGKSEDAPFAEAALTSDHLVPGESCHLIVRMRGGEPDNRPLTPSVPDTAVNFVRSITQVNSRRELTTAFLFRVTPVKTGPLTIPPIALRSRGVTYQTPALTLRVHPLNQLISLPTSIGKRNILVGWFPEKTTLYQGEQSPVTLKLYIPIQLPIARNGWGLPDPEKKNCLAWRFSLPQINDHSQVTIDGDSYQSSTFNTTLSGLTPGTATFGPAPLRIIVRQSIIDPLRGSKLVNTPIQLTLPAISFDILDLPDGAPDTFKGAIGTFSIHATSSQTTLDAKEPTEVLLRIQGRGNLETIQAPQVSGDQWKLIDSTKITRGEERRRMQGTVTFRQLLRPTDPSLITPSNIPAYTFSYFNPEEKSYQTIHTDPIPVHITPSIDLGKTNTPIPEKRGTAPEEMRDILGFINHPNLHSNKKRFHPNFWHIAPALLALLIVSVPLRKKIKSALTKHPDTIRKEKALTELAQETDQRDFYRKAGRFIEQWLTRKSGFQSLNDQTQALDEILSTRDNICFQTEQNTSTPMESGKKKTILALLKLCSKLTLLILIVVIQTGITSQASDAQALARDAWRSGGYQQAIEYYQQAYPEPSTTPADVLYNIGNCHHRLNQPGLAALAWRRALVAHPSHQQARQNLRYVELKQGAAVPIYENWQRPLTTASPRLYQITVQASIWVFALSLLILVIFRPQGIKTTLCIILLVITPVTAALGAMGLHWYPDDHQFAPVDKQAIVLKKTLLYREAHRQDKSPKPLPATTLIAIDAIRGPWTHITTPDGKSGWIPSDEVEMILSLASDLN